MGESKPEPPAALPFALAVAREPLSLRRFSAFSDAALPAADANKCTKIGNSGEAAKSAIGTAKHLECAEIAPAFEPPLPYESGVFADFGGMGGIVFPAARSYLHSSTGAPRSLSIPTTLAHPTRPGTTPDPHRSLTVDNKCYLA